MLKLFTVLAATVLLATAGGAPAFAADPDLAIIITNKGYERHGHTHDVPYAHEDGEAFRRAAVDVFKVPATRVTHVKDAGLGKFYELFGSPRARLGSIYPKLTNPRATLYVFYSGHGMPSAGIDSQASAKPYLMPVEANPSFIHATGFSRDDLIARLKEIKEELLPQGRIVLIMDACFSGVSSKGNIVDKSSAGPFRVPPPQLTNESNDIIVISASREVESAYWDDRAKLGVFTNAILHGIYGLADQERHRGNGDFKLSLGELRQFTSDFMGNRLTVLFPDKARPQNPVFFGPDDFVLASYAAKDYPVRNEAAQDKERSQCLVLSQSRNPAEIDEFLNKTCDICECRDQLIRRKGEIMRAERACQSERETMRTIDGDVDQLKALIGGLLCASLRPEAESLHEELKQTCANEKRDLEAMKGRGNFVSDLEQRLKRGRFRCASVRREASEIVARIQNECRRAREAFPDLKSIGDPDTLDQIASRHRGCPEFADIARRDAADMRQACETEQKQLQAAIRQRSFKRVGEMAEQARCTEVRERARDHMTNARAICATESVKWEQLKTSKTIADLRSFREALVCEDVRPAVEARIGELEAIDRPSLGNGRPGRDCTAACPEVVMVQPGCFLMGGEAGDVRTLAAERPQLKMRIPRPFAIGTKEVTIGEWNACYGEKSCELAPPAGVNANLPMSGLSWNDARQYVTWLTVKTKKRYRLPSEAEWEYAARAGQTTAFTFGNEITPKLAQYRASGGKGPAAVASFPANKFGLFDMHGNVAELVADCFNDTHAGRPTDGAAVVHDRASGQCREGRRAVRGGSWRRFDNSLRSAWRDYVAQGQRNDDVGLRVVREIQASESDAQAPASCP